MINAYLVEYPNGRCEVVSEQELTEYELERGENPRPTILATLELRNNCGMTWLYRVVERFDGGEG